jgi:hypothetical protein
VRRRSTRSKVSMGGPAVIASHCDHCGASATRSRFLNGATLQGGLLGRIPMDSTDRGRSMTIGTLTPSKRTRAINEVLASNDIRTVVRCHGGAGCVRPDKAGVSARRPRHAAAFPKGMCGRASVQIPRTMRGVIVAQQLATISLFDGPNPRRMNCPF